MSKYCNACGWHVVDACSELPRKCLETPKELCVRSTNPKEYGVFDIMAQADAADRAEERVNTEHRLMKRALEWIAKANQDENRVFADDVARVALAGGMHDQEPGFVRQKMLEVFEGLLR